MAELWVIFFRRVYFGVSTLTLNQDTSREALRWVGLSPQVLEMGSPHLAPAGLPYNHPWLLGHQVQCRAELLGVTQEEVAEVTRLNPCSLYGLPWRM